MLDTILEFSYLLLALANGYFAGRNIEHKNYKKAGLSIVLSIALLVLWVSQMSITINLNV